MGGVASVPATGRNSMMLVMMSPAADSAARVSAATSSSGVGSGCGFLFFFFWNSRMVSINACRRDAASLAAIAAQIGDSAQGAFDDQVTRELVRKTFAAGAQTLKAGDTFLFTYSGHGYRRTSNAPFVNEEGICLFDGLMSDVEFHNLVALLPAGVNFIGIFDSCHSGGMDRDWSPFAPRFRSAHPRAVGDAMPQGLKSALQCNAIILAACQPTETALDGDKNGAWTECLLAAYESAVRDECPLNWQEWFAHAANICSGRHPSQHPLLKPMGGETQSLLNVRITN